MLDVPLPGLPRAARPAARDRPRSCSAKAARRFTSTASDAEQLVRAALGLTLERGRERVREARSPTTTASTPTTSSLVLEEKRQIIRKSGLLEYYRDRRATWPASAASSTSRPGSTAARARSPTRRAQFGLPEPKGLLLLGVQGCGKSLTAKAIAAHWRMPLLRLDMGRIFGGPGRLVGGERAPRDQDRRERRAGACCGSTRSRRASRASRSSGDDRRRRHRARVRHAPHLAAGEDGAGVRRRDREPHRGPAARAAAQGPLRRDLLRRPARRRASAPRSSRSTCGAATAIPRASTSPTLARRRARASPARRSSRRWSPGLYHAFDERCDLAQHHVEHALVETRPLSMTMHEEIVRLREWARTRARGASDPEDLE